MTRIFLQKYVMRKAKELEELRQLIEWLSQNCVWLLHVDLLYAFLDWIAVKLELKPPSNFWATV